MRDIAINLDPYSIPMLQPSPRNMKRPRLKKQIPNKLFDVLAALFLRKVARGGIE